MKRIRYLMFVMLCAFLSPLVIKAQCTDQRMAELNKIAGNVQVGYSYKLDEQGLPSLMLHVTNVTNDIFIINENYDVIENSGVLEYTIGDIPLTGMKIEIEIYSNDDLCKGEKLLTKYVNLPYLNDAFNSDTCKEHSDFKYCGLWSEEAVNTDMFNSELNDYLSKQSSSAREEKKANDNNNLFVYLAITGAVVLLTTVIVLMLRRKNLK